MEDAPHRLIVIAVLVALLIGCVALLGFATDQVLEDIENEEQAVLDAIRITNCGIDTVLGWAEVEVEYTSPFEERKSWVGVDVAFTDGSGVAVGSGTATFENVAAGARGRDTVTWPITDGTTSVSCEAVDATVLD